MGLDFDSNERTSTPDFHFNERTRCRDFDSKSINGPILVPIKEQGAQMLDLMIER